MANLLALYTEEAVALGHPTKSDVINRANPLAAQCRLGYVSASVVRLSRRGGKKIPVKNGSSWEYWEIPSAGVDIASTDLAANDTAYYVYAKIAASALALEVSATGHAADSDTGVEIKSGDATRTLVGMVRKTGGNFQDSITQRFTRSWFNRRRLPLFNAFTADRTTASATFVELSTEIRVEFISWAGEMAAASVIANAHHPTAGNRTEAMIAVDAATTALGAGGRMTAPANAYVVPLPAHGRDNTLPEGYHYLTLSGRSVDGGTATFLGSATPERCSLSAGIGGEA